MPRVNQKDLVLKYLQEYKSITPLEAMRDLGVYRLSAVVFDLRNDEGYDIQTEMIDVPNRYGTKSRVARYKHAEKLPSQMKFITF